MEWKPISEAKREHGKRLLCYNLEIGEFVCEWFTDKFVYSWNQERCPVTHFMPLPAAPKED